VLDNAKVAAWVSTQFKENGIGEIVSFSGIFESKIVTTMKGRRTRSTGAILRDTVFDVAFSQDDGRNIGSSDAGRVCEGARGHPELSAD
jgi:hypothetical protein